MYQRKQKQEQKQEPQERAALQVTSCIVRRAFRIEKSGAELFDMDLNGITIYGCRIVDGKNGTFISYPASKGKDGKYYSHVYALLDDATVESICKQVADLLDK